MTFSEADTFEIPAVDFSAFQVEGPPTTPGHLDVAAALDRACRDHGFVCLRNSGLSKTLIASMFQHSQRLFDSTDEEKSKLMKLDPTENIGYNGFQKEALNRRRSPDLKESFNVRKPSEGGYSGFQGTDQEFQEVATEFWNEVTTLGHKFAVCCAIALGLESDYFSKTLVELDLTTVRLLHYPPVESSSSSSSSGDKEDSPTESIRVGEHTDFGLFTFLFVRDIADASSQGLQVKAIDGADLGLGSLTERDASVFTSGWKDIVFGDDFLKEIEGDDTATLLVNTGALMARWTNDTWRATAHRVIVKPEARCFHRYSIASFFDPDKKTICSVNPMFVREGEEPKYPPISSMDYLFMKLKEMTEINDKE